MSSTPPPPLANSFVIGTAVINTHTLLPRPGWAPDPLMVGIRSPDGLEEEEEEEEEDLFVFNDTIEGPRAPAVKPGRGGWVLHQPPWSFGFDSQTRGTRENRAPPCVKVPGSSRVPLSPRHYDHFLPHALRVFASSFSTGPPRDHGALHCLWTAIATKPIGQCVPVQTCGILHGPEEQSRPHDGKSIGITDQPQYPRL